MVTMEEVIASADKEAFVKVVRLAQKRDMKGTNGNWKDFLRFHDKKFGASLSDPRKRSLDILAAFVKTFTRKEDLKCFAQVIKHHTNQKAMEQLVKCAQQNESPEQKLVRLTIEHPQYLQRYSFPSHNEDWVITKVGKISKAMKSIVMIAVDCEMVLCEDGCDALVKVCAVDQNLEVKLDELVKPTKAVADYRTEITGITSKDLEGVTHDLVDVQKSLKKLLVPGTILIGHSLHNDLEALKIDHARVIDTAFIFKYLDKPSSYTPSMNSLCKSVLGHEVRKLDAPHICLDDACAAMKLVFAKLEHGFNDPIAIPSKEVPETELTKLLLHKIPMNVSSKELLKLFPMDSSVELEPSLRIRDKNCSTFAVFNTSKAAHEAFETIKGELHKDSNGWPQKLVELQLNKGSTVKLYVRKMVANDPLNYSKRMATEEITGLNKSKKLKLELNDSKEQMPDLKNTSHLLEEIERLKQELKQRDEQINNMQKILTALTRKHGL